MVPDERLSSSSSPMKRDAMSSRARHPSMSAADTGERVRKHLAIFWRLKCFLVYSCPSSSSHHASVSAFCGQISEAGCVMGSLLGWVGSGFFARNSLMLVGAAEGVKSESHSLVGLRHPCARSIEHSERVHEWKQAQAHCRLASSPYGLARGCCV